MLINNSSKDCKAQHKQESYCCFLIVCCQCKRVLTEQKAHFSQNNNPTGASRCGPVQLPSGLSQKLLILNRDNWRNYNLQNKCQSLQWQTLPVIITAKNTEIPFPFHQHHLGLCGVCCTVPAHLEKMLHL